MTERGRPNPDTVRDVAVRAIARKEYAEFTRRPWVLALAGVFALLAILASYTASLERSGAASAAGLEATVPALRSLAGFFLPLIAIVMAHQALAGEQESGSLGLLLAQPITRAEVLVGKYVGLMGVLGTAVLLGFGVGGAVIAARAGVEGWGAFVRFLVATLLYASAYFALFVAISALFSRRTPALFASLGVAVFLGTFWLPIKFILLLNFGRPQMLQEPLWWQLIDFASIPALYTRFMTSITTEPQLGLTGVQNLLAGPWAGLTYGAALVLWAVGALAVADRALAKKDV